MTTFNILEKIGSKVVVRNTTAREFLAEMLGTFVLVLMGNGAVAQSVLSGKANGDFFSINVGYAAAVYLGVLVSGGISGGHINPAVSLSMAMFGKFPWCKVPIYMVAQYCGAFIGALMVFLVYRNGLDTYDPGRTMATAGIFATYPGTVLNRTGFPDSNFLSSGNGMGDQILGTAILLLCVCAISDPKNLAIPKHQVPAAVAMVVLNIGLTLGLNCGYAINPARDLGPRLFTLVAGWGSQTFTAGTSDGVAWWWIPVVGTHIGGILGVGLYFLAVELHHGAADADLDLEKARKQCDQEAATSLLKEPGSAAAAAAATAAAAHTTAAKVLNTAT